VLRVGLIGLGGIAKAHLKGLAIMEAEGVARCVAATDLVEALRTKHQQEWKIPKVYDHHTKLLADPDVDAVAVILGHHLHAPLVIDSLNAGKPTFVEKPMAISLDECDAMIEAEQKSGKILQVGFTGRFHPACRKAREILDTNELGPVIHAVSTMSKPFNYKSRRYQDRTRAIGGGMWLGNGVHVVDWLTHCIGSKAVSVKAKLGTHMHYMHGDDTGTAFIQYANGLAGMAVAIGTKRGVEKTMVEAHCVDGQINYSVRGSLEIGQDGKWRPVEHDGKDGFAEQYRHFAQAIRMNLRPQTSSWYGRHIMEILFAAEASSVTGREVQLTGAHEPW